MLSGTGLLEFADVQSPRVPTIPLTQHVAEKVHAYARMNCPGFLGDSGLPFQRPLVVLIGPGSISRGRVLRGPDASLWAGDSSW